MAELIAAFESHGSDWAAGLSALKYLCDDCPACILAAIRQSPAWQKAREEAEERCQPGPELDFDFRADVAEFWREMNAARSAADPPGFYEPGPGLLCEPAENWR